jgi:outer membrane PBP1 activator LpoA protein
LLVPLLAGNDAADIPTYATSEVYDPARSGGNTDLDGLIFPDLPLLLNPAGDARIAATMLTEFTSDSAEQYLRLFAFGFDAYNLAIGLYAGTTNWPMAGATGELYVDGTGRIRRILPFAEFRGGRPQATEPAIGLFGAR